MLVYNKNLNFIIPDRIKFFYSFIKYVLYIIMYGKSKYRIY